MSEAIERSWYGRDLVVGQAVRDRCADDPDAAYGVVEGVDTEDRYTVRFPDRVVENVPREHLVEA